MCACKAPLSVPHFGCARALGRQAGTLTAACGLSVECAVHPSVGVNLHMSVCQSFRGTASDHLIASCVSCLRFNSVLKLGISGALPCLDYGVSHLSSNISIGFKLGLNF